MSNKSFFESKKFKTTMNFVYGIGAAVVIVGALFKKKQQKQKKT